MFASRFKTYAVSDGLLVTSQHQYSTTATATTTATARLVIEAIGV